MRSKLAKPPKPSACPKAKAIWLTIKPTSSTQFDRARKLWRMKSSATALPSAATWQITRTSRTLSQPGTRQEKGLRGERRVVLTSDYTVILSEARTP